MSFWAERFRNGLIYVGVSIAFMVGVYSLFLKPTNKTVNNAPSDHTFDNAQVHIYPCGRFLTYGNLK